MIRKLFTISILALTATTAEAQYAVFDDYDHRRTTGLIDVGYEFVDDGNAYNANIGLNYEIGSCFYLGARAGYTLYKYDDFGMQITNHYINVPVEIGYNSALTHTFGINIYGGARGEYCVANSVKFDGEKQDVGKPDGLHISGVVGARVFLSNFFVGAAYNIPLKKDDEASGLKKGLSDDAYFSASIGFKF